MDQVRDAEGARDGRSVGLVSPLPPQVGGVARVAEWLLSNQTAIGCRYEVFDLPRRSAHEIGGRFHPAAVPYQLRLFARFLAWLGHAPRIVHVAVSGSASGLLRDLVLVACARASGRRVIAHVHSHNEASTRSARLFHVPALKLVARLSSECVALGPTAAGRLRRSGIPCRWIYNPVPHSVAAANGSHADEPRALRLLYVGVYGTKKGTFDLLRALARARASGVDARLCVVGRAMYPDEAAKAARLVSELHLEDAVAFAGEQPPGEVASFHADADVICMPSWQEGLPMALLEGMAAGLPPLATSVGCVPDVIEPDREGILVTPRDVSGLADGIAALAADAGRRRAMGAAARARAREVGSPERIAAEWNELYAAVALDGRA